MCETLVIRLRLMSSIQLLTGELNPLKLSLSQQGDRTLFDLDFTVTPEIHKWYTPVVHTLR